MENQELVLNFMEFTNLPIEEAQRFLRAAENNLELAIQNFYENNIPADLSSPPATQGSSSLASSQNSTQEESQEQSSFQEDYEEEEEIRPALPREYSQLVEDESQRNIQLNRVKRQFNSNFRNFRQEMEIQENLANGIETKKKCLEDIYRNPIDITFNIDFQSAKYVGQKQGKWIALLLNDESFPSLSFNREIFNRDENQRVKSLIKRNFIFLRKNSNSDEGMSILQNYNLHSHSIPIFLIIDSMTGELRKNFGVVTDLKLKTVIKELKKYSCSADKQLSYTSDVSEEDSDPDEYISKSTIYSASTSSSQLLKTSTIVKTTTEAKINEKLRKYESDEESFASLKSDDVETSDEGENNVEEAKVLDSDDELLKTETESQTNILLKFSDQSHNFKYPSKRTVRHLIDYIYRNYLVQTGLYDDQRNRFSLFSKVHNKCITTIDPTQTLEDSKIHPSCCLLHRVIEKE